MKKELINIATETVLGGAAVSIITKFGLGDGWLGYAAATTCIFAGGASVIEFNGRNRFIAPVILGLSGAAAGYIGSGRWEGAAIGLFAGITASQITSVPIIARLFKQA